MSGITVLDFARCLARGIGTLLVVVAVLVVAFIGLPALATAATHVSGDGYHRVHE